MVTRKKRIKLLRIFSFTAIALTAIAFIVVLIVRNVLSNNNISYSSLRYSFPSHIEISGLKIAPDSTFSVEADEIRVSWSWRSLLRGKPTVTLLRLNSGRIALYSSGESSSGNVEIPSFEVEDVLLSDIDFDLDGPDQSMDFTVKSIYLSSVVSGEKLLVDSLELTNPDVYYAFRSTSEESDSASFEFGSIPAFEINSIILSDAGVEIDNGQSPQLISSLDFRFTGWKSSNLFDFGIERLDFRYQDTLDMNIILENGQVNEDLVADLEDVLLEIPGLRLDVAKVKIQAEPRLDISLDLNPSFIAAGRIRQFYPDFDSVFNYRMPGDSLFRFGGLIHYGDPRIHIEKFQLSLFDSTRLTAAGDIILQEGFPEISVGVEPFETTRSNLELLLAEAGYQEFYEWPGGINGRIDIRTIDGHLEFSGNLDTRQGSLSALSRVYVDSLSAEIFDLEILGDSILLDQVVTMVPDTIPWADLRFYIGLRDTRSDRGEEILIEASSRRIFAFGHLLTNLEATFISDEISDSLYASLNDDKLELQASLLMPSSENEVSGFQVALAGLSPGLFVPVEKDVTLNTSIRGDFSTAEESFKLSMVMEGLTLLSPRGDFRPAVSEWDLEMVDERINLVLSAGGDEILDLNTGTAFPELSFPINHWIADLPETNMEMRVDSVDKLVNILTGKNLAFNARPLILNKSDERLDLQGGFSSVQYEDLRIEGINFAVNSSRESLGSDIRAESVSETGLNIADLLVNIEYADDFYQLSISGKEPGTGLSSLLALELEELEEGYRLALNESAGLVLEDRRWEVLDNRGIQFDDSLKISGGNLALARGQTKLGFSTSQNQGTFRIDSLDISTVLEYFTGQEFLKGQLSTRVMYDWSESRTQGDGKVLLYSSNDSIPGTIDFKGSYVNDSLDAMLDLAHRDAGARVAIHSEEKQILYSALLYKFDLGFLSWTPGMPEGLIVDGKLSGRATGKLGDEITAEGYFVTDSLDVIYAETGSRVLVPRDSFLLQDRFLVFRDFELEDSEKGRMLLNGGIQFSPDIRFDLAAKTQGFRAVNDYSSEAMIRGSADISADLMVKGNLEELDITGNMASLPGADLIYEITESLNLVDPSQIVTFASFDEAAEGKSPGGRSGSTIQLNWDVRLELSQVGAEILLNEVSQEFVRLNGSGSLALKPGNGSIPMIYGSFSSERGNAFIQPPAIPDLNLIIESVDVQWNGPALEPVIQFRGYEEAKASPGGLSPQFDENMAPEDFRVYMVLEDATLEDLDIKFDLEGSSAETRAFLETVPEDTRQAYAINLLVFGKLGTAEGVAGSYAAEQITGKLNEIARRNLKNSDLSFSANTYEEQSLDGTRQSRTDLNYSLSRRYLDNRLSFSVGGSLGFYSDDPTDPPPSSLIGNLELRYILSEKPSLILKGERRDVYHGIIDGEITETSGGLLYRKSFPRFDDVFRLRKEDEKKEDQE